MSTKNRLDLAARILRATAKQPDLPDAGWKAQALTAQRAVAILTGGAR